MAWYNVRLTHADGRIEWAKVAAATAAKARTDAKQQTGAVRANVFSTEAMNAQ